MRRKNVRKIKKLLIYQICVIALFLSSCGTQHCFIQESELQEIIDTVYSSTPTKRFMTQIFAYDIICNDSIEEYCVSVKRIVNGECDETQQITYGKITDLEENRIILGFSNNFNQDMSVESFLISFPSGVHLHDLDGLYGIGEYDNLIKGKVVSLEENTDTPVLSIRFTPNATEESYILEYVMCLSVFE